jgi:Zn-dependent protease
MSLSWKLGRVAGIDLYLHPTFLLLLAFVGLGHQGSLLSVLMVSAAFGCVLLHELGHALTAREFGIRTEDITLYPIGGVARLERMPRAPGAELLIALAGPAVNVLIALALGLVQFLGGAWELGAYPTLPGLFVRSLLWFNLGLALFNLIPAFPMDGGRVLRALLSSRMGRLRATEAAASIGQGLALVFGLYCVTQGMWLQAFLATFIYFAARSELANVRDEEHSRQQRHPRDPDIRFAPAGYRWESRGQGLWQLVPVVVNDPLRSSSPWR